MAEIGKATSTNEDTKVTSFHGMDISTLTPAGAAYVKKKIHPPAPDDAAYCGRPSVASSEIVLFQTPGETDVRPLFVYKTDPESSDLTYINPESMLFLTMPGGVVASYIFMKVADNTYAQQQALNNLSIAPGLQPPAALNTGYDWENNYGVDVGLHYVDYKSTTFYANTTDFNNQGLISTSTFKPDIVTGMSAASYTATINMKSRKAFLDACRLPTETVFEGEDTDFTVLSSTSKHGHNVRAPVADFTVQILNFGVSNATISNLGANETIIGLFPNDVGSLQVMSKNNATRPFKDGAFVVARDAEEVQTFMSKPLSTNATGNYTLPRCFLCWYNPAANSYIYYALNSRTIMTGSEIPTKSNDIPWSNTTASLTLVQGMSVPSAVTQSPQSLPYVSIKSITGYSVQPAITSSLNVFVRELPFPDQAAIDMIACINRNRPDSLPASANDFGTVAKTILSLAPTVISGIKSLFGSKKESKATIDKVSESISTSDERKKQNNKIRALEAKIASMELGAKRGPSGNTGSFVPPTSQSLVRPAVQALPQRKSRKRRSRARQRDAAAPVRRTMDKEMVVLSPAEYEELRGLM